MKPLLRYITGPISSSRGLNNIHFVMANHGNRSAHVKVRILDLSNMKLIFEQDYNLSAHAMIHGEKLTGVAYWEAQFITMNRQTTFWVAGRDSIVNLPGNTVIHSNLIVLQ